MSKQKWFSEMLSGSEYFSLVPDLVWKKAPFLKTESQIHSQPNIINEFMILLKEKQSSAMLFIPTD